MLKDESLAGDYNIYYLVLSYQEEGLYKEENLRLHIARNVRFESGSLVGSVQYDEKE